MYYKLELLSNGTIKVVDIVNERKPDGYLYATEKEFKKLNKNYVDNYADGVEL